MRASGLAAVLVAATALSGCSGCGKAEKSAHAQEGLAPLTVANAALPLPVNGFGDAVVAVPLGTTRSLPVVVAVLGIGDTPEEQCEAWRDIVGTRAFVLCPRGAKHWVVPNEEDGGAVPAPTAAPPVPMPVATVVESAEPASSGEAPAAPKEAPPRAIMQPKAASATPIQVGFYPVDVPTLDREVIAGLTALKGRFNAYVEENNVVYAGFSRGAFLGASLIAKHPSLFGRAILIEGGQSAWTPESAATFAKNGGRRVLFACGQPSCLDESGAAANLLKAHRMDIRVVHGAGEGHGYKKQVKEELKKNFGWVVEGDPIWER